MKTQAILTLSVFIIGLALIVHLVTHAIGAV
jgi:hypothetical protein